MRLTADYPDVTCSYSAPPGPDGRSRPGKGPRKEHPAQTHMPCGFTPCNRLLPGGSLSGLRSSAPVVECQQLLGPGSANVLHPPDFSCSADAASMLANSGLNGALRIATFVPLRIARDEVTLSKDVRCTCVFAVVSQARAVPPLLLQ